MDTARLFQSGRSQAVRLPKAYRFAGTEVVVKHFGNGVLADGVAKSGSARNRQALEMFLAPLAVLPFDDAAFWAYGSLRAELERRSTPIGALDTMIAAHALSQQAQLVTHNTREFAQVPGLQLADWTAAA